MKFRKSMLSASIGAALLFAATAQAQDANAQAQTASNSAQPQQLATVQVVGIRASQQQSLNVKRDANAQVQVVSAEDIGKLPAKNVADTIGQLPGITLSTSSLSEGGFDEADRVSMLGTSPSLTQTLIDGHTVATADWFVLSQGTTMGRSVSYTLLPSEIVSQVKVYQSSQARIQDGGATGTVDIITRRPLDFDKQYTFDATLGGVYSQNAGKTDPQGSALFNYKNSNNTFGFLVQAFDEQRSLSRQAQELPSGFTPIAPGSAAAIADPNLSGVFVPSLLGSTYFTQKRERTGGLARAEWKAADNFTVNLTGFYSKLKANNYNRNYMLWGSSFAQTQAPDPGYTVANGVLTNATYTGVPGTNYTVYDMIARDASAKTYFVSADADWNISDSLVAKFQVGTTKGTGQTQRQYIAEVTGNQGGGASWQVNGANAPVDWSVGGDSSPAGVTSFGTWGNQLVKALDKENWFNADFTQFLNLGALSSLNYGVRYADHTRQAVSPEGATPGATEAAAVMASPTSQYPNNFASKIGGDWPRGVWYYDRDALANAVTENSEWLSNNDGPTGRHNYGAEYKVQEKNAAAYVQANFEGDNWSGNFGLRYVDVKQDINSYKTVADAALPADVSSLFGRWNREFTQNKPKRLLPSANLKFNLSQNVVARVAASQTQTLPDYSALGTPVWGSDLDKTGGGGNPDLRPIISTNYSADVEWYFMPRGLVSFGGFSMDLKNYVSFGNELVPEFSELTHQIETYNVSVPVSSHATVNGLLASYIQPIGQYFGVNLNYTYADGKADAGKILNQDGTPDTDMIGTSKNTYNVGVFFENDTFNARLNYTSRSAFLIGLDGAVPDYQAHIGVLSASVGYSPTKWLSFSLDAMNLNNPVYKYNQSGYIPRAFYANGRQYYLTAHLKF